MSWLPFSSYLLGCTFALAIGCAGARGEKGGLGRAKPPSSAPPLRVVIPIQVRAKYANPRSMAIAVPVRFASPSDPKAVRTLDLELDTGSSGVAVFSSSLSGVPLERFGKPVTKTAC